MEPNLEDVTGQDVQSFGLSAEVSSLPLSRETTNPVASFLAGLCGGSDSSELGEGQQPLNLSPELLAQITAALSGNLVSTNTAATQTDHPPEELPIPETSVSPSTEASLSLPATLPNITGDLSHVLQQDVEEFNSITENPQNLRFDFTPREPTKKKKDIAVYKEQDRFLPIANVGRVMKNALPSSGRVGKDSKECMQECVSEFISFITSEANDRCIQEKRKTITGDDILYAMTTLGFDAYIEPLKLYLQKYREYIKADKVNPHAPDPEHATTHQQQAEAVTADN